MSAGGFHDPRLNRSDDPADARLAGAIDSARTIPGRGLFGGGGFGGAALSARRGTIARTKRHPFQIIPTEPTEDGEPQVKVYLDSWLMGSRVVNDKVSITGLGTPFPIAVGDKIWIEVGVAASAVSGSASIEHGANWGAAYPNPYAGVGAAQTAAYYLIGYVQAYPGTGSEIAGLPSDYPDRLTMDYIDDEEEPALLQIVQCLTTNLIVTIECEETENVVGLATWSAVPAP